MEAKYQVLEKLISLTKGMGIRINTKLYIFIDPNTNPLNYWKYDSQHGKDKAPIKQYEPQYYKDKAPIKQKENILSWLNKSEIWG